MRSHISTVVIAVAFWVAAPGFAQERPGVPTPPRDRAAAAPSGTARLRGRILGADGTPLRRARVTVSAGDIQVSRGIMTGHDGRWEVAGLPAGRYVISASKPGYVGLQYGQRRPFESGTPVVLADGQQMEQIDLALPRGAVITGRILDDGGEPVAQAQVQAQRYQYSPEGQRRLTTANIATTDDLGQFRIYGLNPGDYAISAKVNNQSVLDNLTLSVPAQSATPAESLAQTYYPGTVNPGDAQVVSIGVGQETSIQIQMMPTRVGRIAGVVINSEGKPAAGAQLMMTDGLDTGSLNLGGISGTAADGTFAMNNVPPGEHVIAVTIRPGRPDDPAAEFANVPVTVGAETTTVRIVTGKGALVSGRVTWEGSSSRALPATGGIAVLAGLTSPRVTLQAVTPTLNLTGGSVSGADGTIADDGTFKLAGGAGRSFVRVMPIPPGWSIKSVTVDGQDVTDVPLEMAGRSTVEDVRIVLSDKATDVSGQVSDSRGTALKDYVIVFLPAALAEGVSPQRFIRLVRPDQDGRFRVKGLPPGRYTATALEWIEQGRQFVPEYQQELRKSGKALTLREGESATLDLKLSAQ